MSYANIIEELPEDIRFPMLRFAEAMEASMREQLAVRRSDFDALRTDIRDLVQAQARTEARVEQLAEAQARTEARVAQLAEAQARTEARVEQLAVRMEELAEAQVRTETRLEQLAEAQVRTEARMEQLTNHVDDLAEAQVRTEISLRDLQNTVHDVMIAVEDLVSGLKATREELGGLSMTVGYTLENAAYEALPALLARDHGLIVEGRLLRRHVRDDQGSMKEVNILGTARRNGDIVTIVGESKAQLSKNNVDRFKRRILDLLTERYETIFPVLVTHMISEPDVEEYAREQGIALYYSYEF